MRDYLLMDKLGLAAFRGVVLDVVGEEEDLEDEENDNQFDENDGAKRPADGHVAEPLHVEVDNFQDNVHGLSGLRDTKRFVTKLLFLIGISKFLRKGTAKKEGWRFTNLPVTPAGFKPATF